jgi:hypothetical protein
VRSRGDGESRLNRRLTKRRSDADEASENWLLPRRKFFPVFSVTLCNCTRAALRLAARFTQTHMKNDYSFKLVTLIVFAGVIVAFFSPNHAVSHTDVSAPEAAQTTSHTE